VVVVVKVLANLVEGGRDDDRPVALPLTGRIFGEDHCHSLSEMPVNMAMKDPRARIICLKSEGHVPPINPYDVAARRVDIVWNDLVRGLDNVEVMPVKMERMGTRKVTTARDGNLDNLIRRKSVDVAGREELGWIYAIENLEEDGKILGPVFRREERSGLIRLARCVVDGPSQSPFGCISLEHEVDSDIRRCGAARRPHIVQRMNVRFHKRSMKM